MGAGEDTSREDEANPDPMSKVGRIAFPAFWLQKEAGNDGSRSKENHITHSSHISFLEFI